MMMYDASMHELLYISAGEMNIAVALVTKDEDIREDTSLY